MIIINRDDMKLSIKELDIATKAFKEKGYHIVNDNIERKDYMIKKIISENSIYRVLHIYVIQDNSNWLVIYNSKMLEVMKFFV
jgi:hypothetical protein